MPRGSPTFEFVDELGNQGRVGSGFRNWVRFDLDRLNEGSLSPSDDLLEAVEKGSTVISPGSHPAVF